MVNQHFLYTIAERKEVMMFNEVVHAKHLSSGLRFKSGVPTSLNPTWVWNDVNILLCSVFHNLYFQAIVNYYPGK